MKKPIKWLAALVILVIIFGTIYGVVQQSQRSDANYPQIQIAEDASAALNAGTNPAMLISGTVDIGKSLAPFTIIYSRSGQVVAGSGYLGGSIPTVPLGVLTQAKDKTYNAVTWQPQTGVRIAAVVTTANKYYVLSGRSLTEVQKNEDHTFQLSALGGLAALIVLGAAYVLSRQKA